MFYNCYTLNRLILLKKLYITKKNLSYPLFKIYLFALLQTQQHFNNFVNESIAEKN